MNMIFIMSATVGESLRGDLGGTFKRGCLQIYIKILMLQCDDVKCFLERISECWNHLCRCRPRKLGRCWFPGMFKSPFLVGLQELYLIAELLYEYDSFGEFSHTK